MMKILITGANGLLGQHLVKRLLEHYHSIIATGKGLSRLPFEKSATYTYVDVDITDEGKWIDLINGQKPDVIVHAAAATQVDECELDQTACYNTNVKGTEYVLAGAAAINCHFVYISTDFVFDGTKGNYIENDPPNPVSWYGQTKMKAEAMVRSSDLPWSIARTCLVYGNVLKGTRSNVITWVKQKLESGNKIKVVNDQWRTPTYVDDLAKGIQLMIEQKATGVYHISGKDLLTPYDMAIKTADFFQLDKSLIEKADASSFSQPAKRPPKTGFDISKARNELGYEPINFEEGLRAMFNVS